MGIDEGVVSFVPEFRRLFLLLEEELGVVSRVLDDHREIEIAHPESGCVKL